MIKFLKCIIFFVDKLARFFKYISRNIYSFSLKLFSLEGRIRDYIVLLYKKSCNGGDDNGEA